MESHAKDGEISIYDAVADLDESELHERVKRNAQQTGFELTDEHLEVIDALVEYYRENCQTDDCLEAHRHMRFLEKRFADRGGSKYLYRLFDDNEGPDGVLHAIHHLGDLPGLRLDVDKGFGTAF